MLEVLYSEYDAEHKDDFIFDLPEGVDSWLLLMTQTPTIFYVDVKPIECPPNTVVLYEPHQKIHYKANDQRFVNDWMMFKTDEPFISNSNLPLGTPLKIDDFSFMHNLFRLITIENKSNEEYKEAIMLKLLQIIFYKLLASNIPLQASIIVSDIYDLRKEIQAKPEYDWTLELMADKLNISVGYLQNLYKATFGISCMEEVIKNRIIMAKNLLTTSNFNIAEIANRCGYNTQEHFFRQFKKQTGITPRTYRYNATETQA